MPNRVSKLIRQLDQYIDDEIALRIDPHIKRDKIKSRQRQEFIRYLVSVATHPIGLQASVPPFDCSQEHMLAYIMDMFNVNDTELRKIVSRAQDHKDQRSDDENTGKNDKGPSQMLSQKRHSWRPELRLRLILPELPEYRKFYARDPEARVFIFKEEPSSRVAASEPEFERPRAESVKSKRMLKNIFKEIKADSNAAIRKASDQQTSVKFLMKPDSVRSNTTRPPVSKVEPSVVAEDLHLRIRRYFCDPSTPHILRIELWVNSNRSWLDCHKILKNDSSRILHYILSSTSCRRRAFTRGRDFYGYVNINLACLPSYPTKQTNPILTLRGREINNLIICLELRNRRLVPDEFAKSPVAGPPSEQSRIAGDILIVNHMRLYASCLLYQSSIFAQAMTKSKLDQSTMFQNIALENILYVPAFGLLNQHRLQSNLSWFEDQCLRRTTILSALAKSDLRDPRNTMQLKSHSMLTSVLLNEYLIGQRDMDDRTMQEIDPFTDHLKPDARQTLIISAEVAALETYIEQSLMGRLRTWVKSNFSEGATGGEFDKSFTLTELKMCRIAITYFRRCRRSNLILGRAQIDITKIRLRLNRELYHAVLEQIKKCTHERIIDTSGAKGTKVRGTVAATSSARAISWLDLLRDLRQIDHDLKLHWSRSGLDGVLATDASQPRDAQSNGIFFNSSLREYVRNKLINYTH